MMKRHSFPLRLLYYSLFTFLFSLFTFLSGCTDRNKANGNGTMEPVDTFSYKGYADLANILAGKMPEDNSFLNDITSSDAFTTHKGSMGAMWNRYKKSDIDIIRQWSADNLKISTDTIFYPFGGPDVNYIASFFPDSRFAVLVGIEEAGKLPFLDQLSLQNYTEILTSLRTIISTTVGLSFFQTKHGMETELEGYHHGTLPVITMFLALHGYEVITVNPVKIQPDGTIAYTQPDKVFAHTMKKDMGNSFEVLYRLPGERGARRVYYLNSDLSNEKFAESGMDNLMQKYFKNKTTFLKVASYLLHDPEFSDVQQSLLANSQTILTGPSGMPFAAFNKNEWRFQLYGNYIAPVPQYSDYPQSDLRNFYKSQAHTPLNFRFDYHSSASLVVATRK